MRRVLLAVLLIGFVSLPLFATEPLTLCSFNIKWLGQSEVRDCEALGLLLSNYDVIFVQEIIAPPYAGAFPDGTPYQPDPEVAAFFDEMTQARGYDYLLSEEDTGMQITNQQNSSRTEWFAVFYDPEKIEPAPGLPFGYIADDVTANPEFDRVPHAFSLRYIETGFDFVVVSTHLHAGIEAEDVDRRWSELEAIADWVESQPLEEEHYIVLGNMNFQDCNEIVAIMPAGLRFLNPGYNDACLTTNTSLSIHRPYDNVLYTRHVAVDVIFGLRTIDLVQGLAALWNPFGEPIESAYDDLDFVGQISDHNPVIFKITPASADWD